MRFTWATFIFLSSGALMAQVQETPPINFCGVVQKAYKTVLVIQGQEVSELRMGGYLDRALVARLTSVNCSCVCFTGTLTSVHSLILKSIKPESVTFPAHNRTCSTIAYAGGGLCDGG